MNGMQNIAEHTYTDKGDDQQALTFHLSTLHIRQKVLGETNPSTLDSYKYVALAYENLGDTSQAYHYFKKGADYGCKNCEEYLSEYQQWYIQTNNHQQKHSLHSVNSVIF